MSISISISIRGYDNYYRRQLQQAKKGEDNFSWLECIQKDGRQIWRWRRPLQSGDVWDEDIKQGQGKLWVTFAHFDITKVDPTGPDATMADLRAYGQIDFFTGEHWVKERTNVKFLRKVHGISMITTWAFLTAAGVFVARFLRAYPWWLKVHEGFQSVAFLLTIPIAALAWFSHVKSHIRIRHAKIGVAVSVFSFLQGILGKCLKGEVGMEALAKYRLHYRFTVTGRTRKIIRYWHYWNGRATLCIAFWGMYTGLQTLTLPYAMTYWWLTHVILILMAAMLLEFRKIRIYMQLIRSDLQIWLEQKLASKEKRLKKILRHVTMEELQEHGVGKRNPWIVVEDRVYSVGDFYHPGGQGLLLNLAGRDATIAFQLVHEGSALAIRTMQGIYVGRVSAETKGLLKLLRRVITRGELVEHNASAEQKWISLHGLVYDVTQYVSKHPGGAVLLHRTGRDATEEFSIMHGGNGKVMQTLSQLPIVGATSSHHSQLVRSLRRTNLVIPKELLEPPDQLGIRSTKTKEELRKEALSYSRQQRTKILNMERDTTDNTDFSPLLKEGHTDGYDSLSGKKRLLDTHSGTSSSPLPHNRRASQELVSHHEIEEHTSPMLTDQDILLAESMRHALQLDHGDQELNLREIDPLHLQSVREVDTLDQTVELTDLKAAKSANTMATISETKAAQVVVVVSGSKRTEGEGGSGSDSPSPTGKAAAGGKAMQDSLLASHKLRDSAGANSAPISLTSIQRRDSLVSVLSPVEFEGFTTQRKRSP
eukprot:g79464.t1